MPVWAVIERSTSEDLDSGADHAALLKLAARVLADTREAVMTNTKAMRDAAPDLYLALKNIVEFMPSITSYQRSLIRQADAAIAKAEGR